MLMREEEKKDIVVTSQSYRLFRDLEYLKHCLPFDEISQMIDRDSRVHHRIARKDVIHYCSTVVLQNSIDTNPCIICKKNKKLYNKKIFTIYLYGPEHLKENKIKEANLFLRP